MRAIITSAAVLTLMLVTLMLVTLMLVTLPAVASPKRCKKAQELYFALSVEQALTTVDEVLRSDESPPLQCLAVKAMVLLASQRWQEAEATLVLLFNRSPNYEVVDPSFGEEINSTIKRVRERVRPLDVKVQASWLSPTSIRSDFALTGGLRGAARVRYHARFGALEQKGELPLLGRVATATITLVREVQADVIRLSGTILDNEQREVRRFELDAPLPPPGLNPNPNENRNPDGDKDGEGSSAGLPWYVWLLVGIAGAGAVAGSVAIGIAVQPDLPESRGLGVASVDLP